MQKKEIPASHLSNAMICVAPLHPTTTRRRRPPFPAHGSLSLGAVIQSLAMPPLTHALLLLLLSSCARSSCPECGISDRQQAARLKLQAIKQQILSKLQMQDRPNITSPLPRKVALEALRQAQGEQQGPGDNLDPGEEDAPRDDYYARTSEIIAFAEPGE